MRYRQRYARWRRVVSGIALAALAVGARAEGPIRKDAGHFLLRIRGADVGTDNFTIADGGNSECTVALSMGGRSATGKSTITMAAGRLTSLSTTAQPGGKFSLKIANGKGRFHAEAATKVDKEVPVPAHLLPFGNFMPHLVNYSLAAYDAKRGGGQTFDYVLADNAAGIRATLTAKGTKSVRVANRPVTVALYSLALQGGPQPIAIELTADMAGHLLMWRVPSQQYVAVRDNWKELAKP